jgi:hypothetical protein
MIRTRRREAQLISSFPLDSISENNIFGPTVMTVQKLIKKLINFLGPREEIGSPSEEHSFYYLESVMMVQKLINKFLGPKGRNWASISRAFLLLSRAQFFDAIMCAM